MNSQNSATPWQAVHTDFDAAMLVAHANDDRVVLVELYTTAADMAQTQNDIDAARFYLTQAFVFALDTDHADCQKIKMRLDRYTEW